MPHHYQKAEQEHQALTGTYDDSTDDCESVNLDRPPVPRRTGWRPGCYCLAFLFVLTAVLSGIVGAAWTYHAINLDKLCSAYTTQYSPLLKDVDVQYKMQTFNGSFKAENVYRQAAGPEVDAAWEALGVDSRAGIIPLAEGAASGLTRHHVQVAEKHGGGYFVNVEAMHHLHCLNLVRKGLYYNYDYYKAQGEHAFQNEDVIIRLHVSHCLDTIRQVLMCNADTGVLGQVWHNSKEPEAFPDFHSRHKCKNFDAIRDWAVRLQAPPADSLPADFLKAPAADDVLDQEM